MFEYSSDQEWNQPLNEVYIYGRGFEDIYLNRRKQKIFSKETFLVYLTITKGERKMEDANDLILLSLVNRMTFAFLEKSFVAHI